MAEIKISPRHLAIISELQTRQDYHAFSLGIAIAEYLKRRAVLMDVSGTPDPAKLGALEWARHKQETFWFEKITSTEVLQENAGLEAIRAAGLDPQKADYTLRGDIVMVLRAGEYYPAER